MDPAHHSVVYSQKSAHPGLTMFALASSGGELLPHAAVVATLGVSRSGWQPTSHRSVASKN